MDYPYPAMHTEHVEPPGGGGEQARMERERVDEKKRLKRAANRRSACTSRVRKKQFVEEMTAANERLAIYGAILARAPPTVTVDERCGLRNEMDFWKHRYYKLNSIDEQLNSVNNKLI